MIIDDNCDKGHIYPIYESRVRGILRIHQLCDPDECAKKRTALKWADDHPLSGLPS